jgi:hypothetical protein
MFDTPLLIGLFVAWAVVTAIWIVLMIYRGVVGMREEDQVFLHKGEESLVREQKKVVSTLKHLSPYLLCSGVLSIVLLLVLIGLWIYRAWHNV